MHILQFAEGKGDCRNDLALAFYDAYPVNEGHVLIIPKRHVETYFDATQDEKNAISLLLAKAKENWMNVFIRMATI